MASVPLGCLFLGIIVTIGAALLILIFADLLRIVWNDSFGRKAEPKKKENQVAAEQVVAVAGLDTKVPAAKINDTVSETGLDRECGWEDITDEFEDQRSKA